MNIYDASEAVIAFEAMIKETASIWQPAALVYRSLIENAADRYNRTATLYRSTL